MANAKTQDQLSSCPECGFGPFTRNHFFTGKLMTARDFTDESRFHSERMRHHNAHLHGWGVVCGLKVKAYENAACRDRFVEIEPGTAIDCCGNEILVTEAVTVELAQLPAVADLIKKKDTEPHRLQICIHYQECPTEEVPVLYDECGCDDTRCAPNRILSSYGVDAILDGDVTPLGPHTPSLKWKAPISPADAKQVVFDSKNKRLYATTSDQNVIYQINTETNMVVGTVSVQALPLNLALSKNGDRLFVVTEPPEGEISTKRQLLVYDTADLKKNPIRSVEIPNSDEGAIDLAVAPDDRLFALAGKAGKITSWPADVKIKGKKASTAKATIGSNLQGLTLSSDGKRAYAIDLVNAQLIAVDIKATGEIEASTPIGALAAEAAPTGVALVSSTGPDLLAVISETKRNLYLVDADKEKLLGVALLEHPPIAVAVSPGGQYAYVVETEEASGSSYVQAVNLFGIQQGLERVTATPVQVGDNSQSVVVTPSGDRLYIPYTPTETGTGGIGMVEVSEQDCGEILWGHLDGCASCDTANCVVLATIENYVVDFKIEDPTDPASDPLEDKEAGIARIDNKAGRQLLPSTAVLLEMVECLLEQGCSDCTGTQGPPGTGATVESIPPDPTSTTCPRGGAKITDGLGHVAYVCNGAPGANGTPGVGVTVVTEPSGSHCPNGGIKVTDGSGQVTYVCNGAPGTHGTPGVGVTVEEVPEGTICPNGGIKVTDGKGQVAYVCNGANGRDGVGLEENLTRIKALSWHHDTGSNPILEINCLNNHWNDDDFQETLPGIVIGFTGEVHVGDPSSPGTTDHEINAHHVFQVYVFQKGSDIIERVHLLGITIPVRYTEGSPGFITDAQEVSGDKSDGVAFLLPPGYRPDQLSEMGGELWVRLQGDFVIDTEGRAIDAEFVRAELETGDRPNGSSGGIQGGQFESWFWINGKNL